MAEPFPLVELVNIPVCSQCTCGTAWGGHALHNKNRNQQDSWARAPRRDMGSRGELLLTLLLLLSVTFICETALLRKSSAVDFLKSGRERRALRCFNGGCSSEDSEAEEAPEVNSDYEQENSKLFFNAVAQGGAQMKPDGEIQGEGSGM
ncbi:hypothetical protein DNTS_004542 [Danionella cerebrum]|uniref:Uncharacterized protein n=1 Tax=Danionella cerebrum TaxID=2873325 RepID=A0A553RKL1_9TELE|nr:hypothetical protein DNTS_004542 [Danionella translucida]